MLYEREPIDFEPVSDVSGCFCEVNGEFLLLKRQDDKSYPNKWELPGGKAEPGETPEQAAIRETREETKIDVRDGLSFFKTVYGKYPNGDFYYRIFHTVLSTKPNVVLSLEHSDFAWVTPAKALQMDLIDDLDVRINMLYPPKRPQAA